MGWVGVDLGGDCMIGDFCGWVLMLWYGWGIVW